MNRKSCIILAVILICAVAGGGFLFFLYDRDKGETEGQKPEELPPEVMAELLGETPAAVTEKKAAADSRVAIECEVPEVPEKMEIVSWEHMDMTREQAYWEEVVKDNPEQREYKLMLRVNGDLPATKKNPYMYQYIGYNNSGIFISKMKNDGMSRDRRVDEKQAVKKVARLLEDLSLAAEPEEQWECERSHDIHGEESKKYYRIRVRQGYRGWPVLYTIYGYKCGDVYENDELFENNNPWQFYYGDTGWLDIDMAGCKKLTGTGEYVDIMPLEEATGFLAERTGEYHIRKVQFGYWHGKDHTLRPYWYVEDPSRYPYCIDAATGEIYGAEDDPAYDHAAISGEMAGSEKGGMP